MKKFYLIFLLILAFIPRNSFAVNYESCNYISNFKYIDDKNYGFICLKNGLNYLVVNDKISSSGYNSIYNFYVSNSLNKIAIIGTKVGDSQNGMLYLNDEIIYNSEFINEVSFSPKTNDLYFISGNKLFKNQSEVSFNGITEFYNLSFNKNGDLYYMGCNGGCNIYKNNKIFSNNSDNLNIIGNTFGYIKSENGLNKIIINGNVKYSSKNSLVNLTINENGDFYVIENNGNTNSIIFNKKILQSKLSEIGQFSVSKNFKKYSFTTYKNNIGNFYYNNKILYSNESLLLDQIFYKDNFYYQKNDFCYYDLKGKTDTKYCKKGTYSTISSNDNNHLFQGFTQGGSSFTLDGKNYNYNGTDFNFLGFSPDSKQAIFGIGKGDGYKTYFMKLK